jgi:hypothetical protein
MTTSRSRKFSPVVVRHVAPTATGTMTVAEARKRVGDLGEERSYGVTDSGQRPAMGMHATHERARVIVSRGEGFAVVDPGEELAA